MNITVHTPQGGAKSYDEVSLDEGPLEGSLKISEMGDNLSTILEGGGKMSRTLAIYAPGMWSHVTMHYHREPT